MGIDAEVAKEMEKMKVERTMLMEELARIKAAVHPQEISIIPFKGYDLDGKMVDVAACIGRKPVVLIFWASWCAACRAEIPRLNEMAGKYGEGMEFIGVNIAENDTYKRAKAFAAKAKMQLFTGPDADACNSMENPDRLHAVDMPVDVADGKVRRVFPALSFSIIRVPLASRR